jgi:hypothetical protein
VSKAAQVGLQANISSGCPRRSNWGQVAAMPTLHHGKDSSCARLGDQRRSQLRRRSVAVTGAPQPNIEELTFGALHGLCLNAVHRPLIDFECRPRHGQDDFLQHHSLPEQEKGMDHHG